MHLKPTNCLYAFAAAAIAASPALASDVYENGMAVAQTQDGGYVVVGYVGDANSGSIINSTTDFLAIRLDSLGNPDPAFGSQLTGTVRTDLSGSQDMATSLIIQGDQKVIAAGYAGEIRSDFGIVRYNADGSLDPAFGNAGVTTTDLTGNQDVIQAIALQSTGKLVAVGYAYVNDTTTYDFALARYDQNGIIDSTFGGGTGHVFTAISSQQDAPESAVVATTDKIVVSGFTYSPISNNDFVVARYMPDGALDTTFGNGGIAKTDLTNGAQTPSVETGTSVAVQSDQKIVLIGSSSSVSGVEGVLVRYNEDGVLDSTFGTNGIVHLGGESRYPRGVLIQPDGKSVIVSDSSTSYTLKVQRFQTDGTVDTTFGTNGALLIPLVYGGNARGIAATSGGFIITGSAFDRDNNSNILAVRISENGVIDGSFYYGTPQDNSLTGTETSDAINGAAGADTLIGSTGSDSLVGGAGNDTLIGDVDGLAITVQARLSATSISSFSSTSTDDVLNGGKGDDLLKGGDGSDTAVYGGPLADYQITYNSSAQALTIVDTVGDRDGTDVLNSIETIRFSDQSIPASTFMVSRIRGTDLSEKLVGTSQAEEIYGFAGDDTLSGLGGADLLNGGTGADQMSGGDGDDSYIIDNAGDKVKETAKAGSGTDTVYTSLPSYTMPANVENLVYTGGSNFSGKGNKSSNRMFGGPAADILDGQKGVDVMAGGAGGDTYVVDSPSDLVNEDTDAGVDQVISTVTITTLNQNVEVLTLKKGNINGTGNALDNVIIGSTSNNILSGGDGADTLVGGLGNDTFFGETAASQGDDADTISYGGAKKGVVFSLANTLAGQKTGGAGTDRIYDISGIENLTGTSFNDNLTGSAIGNVIHGSEGNDLVSGLAGTDVLFGDAGLDIIDCGADTDTDRVAYAQPSDSPVGANRDQITSFSTDTDLIELSLMDANVNAGGDQAFAFSDTTPQANSVWYIVSGNDVVVQGDVNGDAVADFEILVKGGQVLQAATFAL